MTPPPTSIDGTDITGATIDGQDVQEITIDGDTVFTATPSELSGVVFDFNAATVSANDGDPVSTWTDQKASIEVSGSATFRSSTSSLGGNPTLEFDGTSDGYTQSNTGINTDVSAPLSIHTVINPVDNGGTPRIVDSDADNNSYFQLLYRDRNDSYDFVTTNGIFNRIGTPTANPQVLTGVAGGASGVEIRRNDTTLGSNSGDNGGYDGTIAIGFRAATGSERFEGNVARIIWNDTSQVSASELDQFLINKYGI